MDIELVKVTRSLSIVTPWPALYIEPENTIVVADLHLGIEEQREAEGVHIPRSVNPQIFNAILKPVSQTGASKIILLGDLKHEFGRPTEPEWYAAKKLLKQLLSSGLKVDVVRGNHDNYVIYILKELGVPLHNPTMQLEPYTLFHGHLDPALLPEGRRHVIVGHEHPAVAVKDDVGYKHRYKAFLFGRWRDTEVTVLPSVSPLAIGTDVNEVAQEDLLSPLLRLVDLDAFTPYLLDVEHAVKKFPPLGFLRRPPSKSTSFSV